ncbi:phosphotransferase [Streptomyces sp. A7024]|uniref:Phosphotransferase n=1 Tax=Streptomyces coryli TaxID=1128680 RepID=A0A6G4TXS7_9ACTN|nr:phosphotransferase [Streptomyces coryli]
MQTRPIFITDDAIADTVAAHWLPEVVEVEYLPWGFGAHHWRVTGGGTTLFGTLDQLAPRHTAASLEAAYAGAAALADDGLNMVCAPLPSRDGRFTVDAGAGVLSTTPWLDGRSPTEAEARKPRHVREVIDALTTLHRAAPPDTLPSWTPRIGPEFADDLRARTNRPWRSGPLGESARTVLAARHDVIKSWISRYLELAGVAFDHRDRWVPTHGEPHGANQVMGACGLKLVDWESLALAPRERDYVDLFEAAADHSVALDPAMIELFALDWRLSEIAEYARWFAAPHTGTDDDHTALEDLYAELEVADSGSDE